jgi:lipopolysaccharide export system protein LptA
VLLDPLKNKFVYGISVLFLLSAPLAKGDLLDEEEEVSAPVKTPDAGKTNSKSVPSGVKPQKKAPTLPPFIRKSKPLKKPGAKSPQNSAAPSTKSSPALPKTNVAKPAKTSRSVLAPTKKKKKKKNAEKEPVRFESNGARGIRDKGKFELIDDVVITQGTMRMEADQAIIYVDQESNDVKTVHATGNVKLFQEDEETGERLKAFGEKMVFNNIKRNIVLSGNARLWRGPSLVRGKKIIYELDTGWIYADKVVGEMHADDAGKKTGDEKSTDGKVKNDPAGKKGEDK